jgi:hypothetical protein
MAETKKQTKTTPANNIEKYLKDFSRATNYVRDNYHDKWFDYWKAYNGKRTKIGYNSIADAFVPETRTIVESLVANIAGAQPKFEYIPTHEEQSRETKVLSNLIAYYWDANHMGTKSQSWVRDAILYGTGILHVSWDGDRNVPCIDNIPLRDFFVDDSATTLENARFAGYRYLGDKEAMLAEEVLDENGDLVKKYKNLENLSTGTASGNAPESMDKANKESLMGSVSSKNEERQIEVILIYYMETGKEKIVEIANRTTIIREVDTPYQQEEMEQDVEVIGLDGAPIQQKKTIEAIKPFMPFAILRNTIDSSLFFGTGDVEVIIDRQETLNDVENLDLDNLHYLNNVMWRIDPAYEDMAGEIESTPGIVIPIPRYGLEPITKPQMTADLDAKKQEIKDEMRRATAADEVIQGAAPTGSRTTATEIAQVSNQAMTRFQTKVTNLESEGFAQLGSVLFKMAQIFTDQDTVVRIVGEEGVTFKDFDPFEFSGYYEPHVKLDSTVKRMKEERGMKDNQLFQLLVNNPAIPNQEAVIRMIGKSLDANEEDINKLFEVPAQMMQPPVDPNAQPPVDPAEEEQMAIQAARDDFAAQNVGDDIDPNAEPIDPAAEEELAKALAREDFQNQQ